MIKTFIKFALFVIVAHVATYFFAGIIAQLLLGASDYYPPSPTAISYLRDPRGSVVQAWLVPAQLLRGLIFASVLFPFRRRILELGIWRGGFALGAIIFLVGYVAASGGMFEHFLFFNEYPPRFAAITLVEILIQCVIMGPFIVYLDKRFNLQGTFEVKV